MVLAGLGVFRVLAGFGVFRVCRFRWVLPCRWPASSFPEIVSFKGGTGGGEDDMQWLSVQCKEQECPVGMGVGGLLERAEAGAQCPWVGCAPLRKATTSGFIFLICCLVQPQEWQASGQAWVNAWQLSRAEVPSVLGAEGRNF